MLRRLTMIAIGLGIIGFCMGMMPQKVEGANLYVEAVHSKHKWEWGWVKECYSKWKRFQLWGDKGGKTFWGIPKGWHKGYAYMDCGGNDWNWVYLPNKWSWKTVTVYP